MARTGMSSDKARRNVRIAQFLGLGLGVSAVALWLLDLPGLSAAMPPKPVVQERSTTQAEKAAPTIIAITSEAPLGINERLEIAANRPPKTEAPGEAQAQVQPDQPQTEQGGHWKYLGPIREATRTLALVSVDSIQRIVGEGAKVSLMTPGAEGRPESVSYSAVVKTIRPEYIEVQEENGKLTRVDLEARSAKVAWVKNMPTTVAGTAVSASAAGLTPEARQRLISQGINPQEIERARQAAAASAANGRTRAVPNDPGTVVRTVAGSAVNKGGSDADAANGAKKSDSQTTDADSAEDAAGKRKRPTGAVN